MSVDLLTDQLLVNATVIIWMLSCSEGRQSYEDCCELGIYFAREFICGCRPSIPSYKLDHEPPKARLMPWQRVAEDIGLVFQESTNFLFGKEKSDLPRST